MISYIFENLIANNQDPVVQRMDNAIHWINHCPTDSVVCFLTRIHWIVIYPVDSVILPLNNWGQFFKSRFNVPFQSQGGT